MIMETFPVGLLQCNCVILSCEETREALVIDPGDEVERILASLEERGLKVTGILHTHAHLDHIGATCPLAKATGAPILLHAGELPLYQNVAAQADFLGIEAPPVAPIDRYIKDGESIQWGQNSGEVLHTPGHTPGSVCLRVAGFKPDALQGSSPDLLLAGDTLFAGSIGRTDLWGGDYEQILRSIRERLLALPDETVVLPGHGPSTTIGRERRENPFLIG